MYTFHSFVPLESRETVQAWIDELGVDLLIKNPRKTKLGDFKVQHGKLSISVNNNLNPYSFLITLTHELAHAFVYTKHSSKVLPHGLQWKKTFKSMLLNFLHLFPEDINKVLSLYLLNPKASTLTDIRLSTVLRKYDKQKGITITDILEGDKFKTSNGKEFKKGKKLRKRFSCKEKDTNRVYLFHPLAEVNRIQ
ncbi:MAG: sprT domain-containing protein [Flavobacteriales bacterium]|mgnify:FL=1|jgi:SprT protein|nr:sprT domain-containing protein [Flavobacteriales bacterium]MBT5090689.1 sprT domain-containing protein [Flavobacteriales bacterium]MBT5749630.1 sprT domain-containing protein [Flavobacteriales bacterium]